MRRVRPFSTLLSASALVGVLLAVLSGTAGADRAGPPHIRHAILAGADRAGPAHSRDAILAGAQRTGPADTSRPYAAKLSYDETDPGRQRGQVTVAIEGHGTFSAKLDRGASLDAALIALATGVPVNKIAQGGSYVVSRQIAGNGDVTGMAVAKFRAHGLGSVCLGYVEKPGRYVQAIGFLPMSGSFKTLGGTGSGATWRLRVGFKQNSVSGSSVEQFGASGSERASAGAPVPMTAACRRVAALAKQ
jgi:hypothetical protein